MIRSCGRGKGMGEGTFANILTESTTYQRQETLNKMADRLELGDNYISMSTRIRAPDGGKPRSWMAVLMSIGHAGGPLQVNELCYALAIQLGSTDLHVGYVPSISA